MGGRFSNARGLLLLGAGLAVLLFAAGCGGSSSDDEVTVKTGSLSKAEFIAKADAICAAARTEFEAKLGDLFKTQHTLLGKPNREDELFVTIIDSVVAPNYEGEIKRISALGAPKAFAPEIAVFLNSIQTRIGEVRDDLSKMEDSRYPFQKSANIAEKAGMRGCAESFG
jgi:hypothetical protein